ncbi:hypothetical protein PFICI_07659 [Pestalotiopsis fici W106-1]|uniref:Uncharacterized protein n=1 Tax=Pestalotiopsis fici (strain W106-1 / CGMCC3.15140) TaxID=1229662 RepID=W3X224_PESFW|nr:uncharacterized protein PFICI_07659 [Pestalotiopsis fici W106-1]ETS80130.1 hypothetical protein PFICI_07659 [Pestalotiopsis fici W106-1]
MDDNSETKSLVQHDTHRPRIGFLSLPLEMRWEIYTYLLFLVDPINTAGHSHPSNPKVYPQILSVCRQTHWEAHEMLYRLNTFLAHPSLLTSFPRLREDYSPVVSSAMASLVRRAVLRVRLDIKPGFTRAAAAESLSGLEHLEVEVWQADYRCAGREVLELLEDVRGCRSAVVSGSTGGFQCYARWLEETMMKPLGAPHEDYDGEVGDVSPVSPLRD